MWKLAWLCLWVDFLVKDPGIPTWLSCMAEIGEDSFVLAPDCREVSISQNSDEASSVAFPI